MANRIGNKVVNMVVDIGGGDVRTERNDIRELNKVFVGTEFCRIDRLGVVFKYDSRVSTKTDRIHVFNGAVFNEGESGVLYSKSSLLRGV